jgi:hypothetical protein
MEGKDITAHKTNGNEIETCMGKEIDCNDRDI